MNRKIVARDLLYPECPIRNILARIGDKWSMLVLYTLAERDCMRFNAINNSIPDISQKMLTTTLRTLEQDGLVNRRIYAEVPPRVEYSLTERALTLLPHLNSLIDWSLRNFTDIMHDREMATT
ncbi:MAG: helix-turn-helix transcriptional regulator [Muribaculaceae bacterium]|nr:helix-turn-helix transcriptional regulator [Muribaculaceae bacterium]